jgi:hypothetical protein
MGIRKGSEDAGDESVVVGALDSGELLLARRDTYTYSKVSLHMTCTLWPCLCATYRLETLGRFRCYISDILCACRMRDPRYAASRVKSRFCCSSAHPPPTMQPHCCVLIHWTFCGRSVFQQPINSTCMHSGCIVGCRLISSVSAYYIRTFRIRHDLSRTDSAQLHRYVHMRDFSVRKWRCRTLRNLPIHSFSKGYPTTCSGSREEERKSGQGGRMREV